MDQKRIIARFLERCNRYADERLAHYRGQLDAASGMDLLAVQDKIGHWTAYRAFNEYTLAELDDGTLDDWF